MTNKQFFSQLEPVTLSPLKASVKITLGSSTELNQCNVSMFPDLQRH